ncbi:pentapeptide repeat-containing protein [Yoonia sp. SDW83-1]|uniref:pentapeptide repeat-containing protein n=1 Tax=Yoonia sp. SDW83-1 TaxID=3366945 RepID=UPI00398C7BA6
MPKPCRQVSLTSMNSPSPADTQVSADDAVKRIGELTRNTRTTWFSLLGVLLFVGITLLGFQHIDFYGYGRQTNLPLIGVSVPTRFFFLTAPLLVAANFIYFHLYLIRLWDALGDAPAKVDGMPLGRAIPPWLITDAALWLRNRIRQDGCIDARPLEGVTAILNFALTWGLGLLVGAMSWWLSAVARDGMMTGLAALALSGMILTAMTSLVALWHRMVSNRAPGQPLLATAMAVVTVACLAAPSYFRTVEPAPWTAETEWLSVWNEETGRMEQQQIAVPEFADRDTDLWERFWTLAEINLEGENIVERPANWLPYDLVRTDYERQWCAREAISNCDLTGDDLDRLSDEFWDRQDSAMALLQRPDWHLPGRKKPDFRGANLRETFLADIDLAGARLQGADLSEADLRGADLSGANLQWAELEEAEMQGTDLEEAALQWAGLGEAKLQEANIEQAKLQMASLQGASLQGASLKAATAQMANLRGANLQRADFTGAELQATDFRDAAMQDTELGLAKLLGANLSKAGLEGANLALTGLQLANLDGANLQHADLYAANMAGAQLVTALLQDANLSGAKLTDANLDRAQFENTKLDGSTMSGANLSYSFIQGVSIKPFDILRSEFGIGWPQTDILQHFHSFNGTINNGGAVRDVDLTQDTVVSQLDWRNAFLDASVVGQEGLLDAMKLTSPPCQWADEKLDDVAFYGRWRGWLDLNPDPASEIVYHWTGLVPTAWKDVTPIPPPPGCVWATGTLPSNP